MQRGVSHEAVADLDARRHELIAIANSGLHLELAGLVVHEQNAERPVIDDAACDARQMREQLVQVQNRSELAGHLRQRLECARVLAFVLEQPRILDRDGDIRTELAQHRFIYQRELPDVFAEQVERADDAALSTKRHHQLRVGARHGFDVPRIGVDIVGQQRQPVRHRRADQALADLHAQRARDFSGIADGIGNRQLVARRIEQVHGKRLELGDPGDELRNLLQQLFEIEHGRDFAAERKERRQRFEGARANVGFCWCSGRFGHSEERV